MDLDLAPAVDRRVSYKADDKTRFLVETANEQAHSMREKTGARREPGMTRTRG